MNQKKIRTLTVSGFRGIRNVITLDFTKRYESVIVFGANAKGKSSLGDAFEWFYTGSVTELTKEGCTRSDYRHRLLDEDEDTVVTLELSDTSLNSDFILSSSRKQAYSNETEQFRRYLDSSKDELLILRHKDLKEFVDETKGNKRKHIAKLIGMEGWEKVRDDMGNAETLLSRSLERQRESRTNRQEEVVQLIGTAEFDEGACWKFAEQQASVLGISYRIRNLNDLKKADEEAKAVTSATEREAELSMLKKAEEVLQQIIDTPQQASSLVAFSQLYNDFCASPSKVLWQQLIELYKHGKSILESGQWSEDVCPLCGMNVGQGELLTHIQDHELEGSEIQQELDQLSAARAKAKKELRAIGDTLSAINELDLDDKGLARLKAASSNVALALADAKGFSEQEVRTHAAIELEDLNIRTKLDRLTKEANTTLKAIQLRLETLTPTDIERARIEAFQNISNLYTHLFALDKLDDEIRPLESQALSLRIFTRSFEQLRRKTMGDVLEIISSDVSRYFLYLHPDEGFDEILLKFLPDVDGIEFHIYYKGEEITPPRRFFSESYLNSLGVCLFLATVRAFNKENGFILLDDIVNSFDAEHRADLARLLVNEFGDFQLIVLTHDDVWFNLFRRLTQTGWQYKRIRGWSYEEGVDIERTPKDELLDCREALQSGSVDYAAHKVRSYMENRLKRLCYQLGVRLRFRPGAHNDERTVGELVPEMRSYLDERDYFSLVDVSVFNELEASNFVANFGSHDRSSETSSLVMGDVEFALNRMQDLEKIFSCPDCKKKVWDIVDHNYNMRCECGNRSL